MYLTRENFLKGSLSLFIVLTLTYIVSFFLTLGKVSDNERVYLLLSGFFYIFRFGYIVFNDFFYDNDIQHPEEFGTNGNVTISQHKKFIKIYFSYMFFSETGLAIYGCLLLRQNAAFIIVLNVLLQFLFSIIIVVVSAIHLYDNYSKNKLEDCSEGYAIMDV